MIPMCIPVKGPKAALYRRIHGKLKKSMSDAVYTCPRKDGRGRVYVSLLVEHKSYVDNYTPVQIGGYLFSGYQQRIDQGHEQLTPIIPILLYHGRERWEYWPLDKLFDGLDHGLLGFIPKFDYVYSNLHDASDEDIKALGNAFLAGGKESLGQALLLYYLQQADLSPEEVRKIIKKLPQTIRRQVMSTYELLKAEGIEQGIEQGKTAVVANLLTAGKFTISEIANFTTVSEDFVKKVRADLAKKKK